MNLPNRAKYFSFCIEDLYFIKNDNIIFEKNLLRSQTKPIIRNSKTPSAIDNFLLLICNLK